MRPETSQRRSREQAERTQSLRKAARKAVTPRRITDLSLSELNIEWGYVWDDLQAYRRRPRGVARSRQWEQTKAWLERRLKKIETLIKLAERAS